jgi:hypothetical protein
MPRSVTRRTTILVVLLALSLVFAGWQWLRPYDLSADPSARFRIVHAGLKRDHSYFWLDLYLKKSGSLGHDLAKPVILRLADGREIEPADTTIEEVNGQPSESLGFRFWLEEKDFAGPLDLQLNDGTLRVRSGSGLPAVSSDSSSFFTHRNW